MRNAEFLKHVQRKSCGRSSIVRDLRRKSKAIKKGFLFHRSGRGRRQFGIGRGGYGPGFKRGEAK